MDLALERQAYRYRLSEDDTAACRRLLAGALADPRVRPWFEGFPIGLNNQQQKVVQRLHGHTTLTISPLSGNHRNPCAGRRHDSRYRL